MANIQAPFGFRRQSGTGASPTFELQTYNMDYNAIATYFGDPLVRQADGTVAPIAQTTQSVAQILAGIFAGCEYPSVSQKRPLWSNYFPGNDVASGNFVTAYVVNDPNAQFLCQSDNTTFATFTGFSAAGIGANYAYNSGTGNAANGLSGAYVVTSSGAVTATLAFRLISLVTFPPNSQGTQAGAYSFGIVAFNNVETKSLTATI